MTKIEKVAVLGSGVMGSGIAAHIANAGVPVLLLDIVPPQAKNGGAENRNMLAEGALEKLKKVKPAALSHPKKAKLITPGNLEDDLQKLADVDWIIEAVLEDPKVKHDVYKKIDAVRKKGSVVSSNTSTLPLKALVHGQSDAFRNDFMITHFFNPPRYMRLLEVVGEGDEAMRAIAQFADVRLGKGVVRCKDTPGFIANRIGIYWMMVGLLEAMRLGISVEEADAVMGKPVGIPKTGVFGLFDLVGIDLMPHIGKAMLQLLPKEDSFHAMYKEPELIKKMISEGYTGRKGKSGFYRMNKGEGGRKTKEVIDLQTGEYRKESKPKLASVEAAKSGLRALLTHDDIGGQYAYAVMIKTLHYALSLIPEIADDIVSIDQAMKTGFNWKYGPFELVDKLDEPATLSPTYTGSRWLMDEFKKLGMPIPPILLALNNLPIARAKEIEIPPQIQELIDKGLGLKHLSKEAFWDWKTKRQRFSRDFYAIHKGLEHFLLEKKTYVPLERRAGVLLLSDVKLQGKKPVAKNGSASVWDIGDGVALLEFTSKMNSIDPDILTMMGKSLDLVKAGFRGVVIGGDGDNFSVGANLGFMLYAANMAAYPLISDVIRQGQQAVMGLKYAPFPVVSALHGMALGGGCETVLHSTHVQAHLESYTGLVEVGVGLIPGWGGCKEMVFRHVPADGKGGAMVGISKAFENIATAKVSESADLACDMGILRESDGITMNRERLIADAKAVVLKAADGYEAPKPHTVRLPGRGGWAALNMAVDNFVANGMASKHDAFIARHLAMVLTGGDCDISDEITEQHLLDLEHEVFMELVKHPATLDRIEHMLLTGKPLRN